MNWLVYALLALAFYGLWGFFPKVASLHSNPKSIILFETIGILVMNVAILFVMKDKVIWNNKGVLFGSLTGFTGMMGTLFFLYAFNHGKTPVVITVTALYPLIAIILAAIFLKETITVKQWCGMGLALVAMGLMAK